MSSANTRQVGGKHYIRSDMQHWDFAYAIHGRGYFQGQITKYVTRWRFKGGVQDLLKASHFLQKLMELQRAEPWYRRLLLRFEMVDEDHVEIFLRANSISLREALIIKAVSYGDMASLARASRWLSQLINIVGVGTPASATSAYVDQLRR